MLRIKNISKNFGGLKAVEDVNITVGGKDIQSIIGPNGAGKTTLFNLVTGALVPDAGTVVFLGKNITAHSPATLARLGLARTFQRTSIFPQLSVSENISLAVRSRLRMNRRLRISREEQEGIQTETAHLLSDVGLSSNADFTASTLAHGSQRALDIAIGLASKPKLVLMDEPLAGMARSDRESVARLILKLREDFGLSILLVEHDISMIMRLSDRITVMQNGSVIASGSPDEIRNDVNVKKAYLKGSFAE